MSESFSIPSYNPADIQGRAGLLKFIGQRFKSEIQKITPARVVSYDRNTNRAVVQPLGLNITSLGEKLESKPIPNIPVLMLSGGGFTFSFPIKENQLGLLIASDMDISTFKSLAPAFSPFTPASYRQHQYEDGIFIPLQIQGLSAPEDSVVLISGATRIALQNGQAEITASSIIMNGDLTVNGQITASGDIKGANISLSSHTHGGVEPGGGNTGVPQ